MQHLMDIYNHTTTNERFDTKYQETQRKKMANERCCILYEKGKIKNEVNRLMYKKNCDLKEEQELSRCTFKPKLNRNLKKNLESLKIKTREDDTYHRNITWKLMNNER